VVAGCWLERVLLISPGTWQMIHLVDSRLSELESAGTNRWDLVTSMNLEKGKTKVRVLARLGAVIDVLCRSRFRPKASSRPNIRSRFLAAASPSC
jgi:hypothetical protein